MDVFIPSTKWYLFGSALNEDKLAKDFDILIIYENAEEVVFIRTKIHSIELERPLDITYMNAEEAKETNFVESEGCIEIFPNNLLYEDPIK
jgi:predicted nucleotidyltransferase